MASSQQNNTNQQQGPDAGGKPVGGGGKKFKGKTMDLNELLIDMPRMDWAKAMELEPQQQPAVANPDTTTTIVDIKTKIVQTRTNLPSAPRAARATAPEASVIAALAPPYIARVSNISYEATEDAVQDFFERARLTVSRVQMPRDHLNSRTKGYGFVEFADKDMLVDAIQLAGEKLMNRELRIELSVDESRADRQTDGRRTHQQPKDAAAQWRQPQPQRRDYPAYPEAQPRGPPGFSERAVPGPGYGGGTLPRRTPSGQSRGPAYHEAEYQQPQMDFHPRGPMQGGYPIQRASSYHNDMRAAPEQGYNRSHYRQYDRPPPYTQGVPDRTYGRYATDYYGRPQGQGPGPNQHFYPQDYGPYSHQAHYDNQRGGWLYNQQGGGYGPRGGRPPRPPGPGPYLFQQQQQQGGGGVRPPRQRTNSSMTTESVPENGHSEQKERKKLELLPRTKPLKSEEEEEEVAEEQQRSASVFGDAKPVDTSKKEREIEEKLEKEKKEIAKKLEGTRGSVDSGRRRMSERTLSQSSGSGYGGIKSPSAAGEDMTLAPGGVRILQRSRSSPSDEKTSTPPTTAPDDDNTLVEKEEEGEATPEEVSVSEATLEEEPAVTTRRASADRGGGRGRGRGLRRGRDGLPPRGSRTFYRGGASGGGQGQAPAPRGEERGRGRRGGRGGRGRPSSVKREGSSGRDSRRNTGPDQRTAGGKEKAETPPRFRQPPKEPAPLPTLKDPIPKNYADINKFSLLEGISDES